MFFDDEEVKHLGRMPPLERPHLMAIADHRDIEIDQALQDHLDDLAFLQRHYRHIPARASELLRKVLSYRGSHPFWLAVGRATWAALRLELELAGHGRAKPLVVKGLRAAQFAHRQQVAAKNFKSAAAYGSGIGYDSEKDDLAIALRYKSWLERGAHFATEEERIGTQFHFPIVNTTAYLQQHPEIRRLINFGACYGIVDAEIARRNPDVEVYGVDRAVMVRDFNEREFSAPNLHYVAADIVEFVRKHQDLSDTAFLFMRTAFIFPEPFMVDLVQLLGERRIGAMIGIEPYCYSLTENRLYDFCASYQPSIFGRSGMWIHNYPHLAAAAGLRIEQARWLRAPERTGDHKDANRLYSFIASRPSRHDLGGLNVRIDQVSEVGQVPGQRRRAPRPDIRV